MLTQSSPSSLPKLKHAKSHRTMVISTKPSIPKGRLSSLQNSPVHSNERPVPILSTLIDESPLQMNTNIGWNSYRGVKTGSQTTKNARPVLDEQTLKRIDLLVGTQQGRTSGSPEHSESPPSGGSSSRKFNMKKKTVIMKVKTYMENKGIEGGQKNKQFDRKFDVFRKLPTFVDARRLLKNQSDTLVDMVPQAEADSPLFFRQSTGRITVTATNKGRNFAQKRQMTTEFTNESTDLMMKPEGKKGPPGQDEEKKTLVGKLIDHLKSNNAKNFKEENVIDEENTSAKFDRYINKELLDENYNWFHRSQSNPIIFSENKKNDQNTFSITYRDQQSFLPAEKVDPQVQILQQAQKYKEKSEEIIKTLHNTLVHVHKSKMLSESPRQADNFTPSPNEPSVKVTQLTDSTASRISIFKQKSFLVPSLSFKEASSPISVKKGKMSYSKESSPSKQLDRYLSKFVGPASPSPKVPRKISESTNFESPRNPKRTTLKDNTQPEKDMFMNICHQIEDLSATNKDLNKQLKASIKQMDESYMRQTQMFKNFGIPESLQGVTPESSIKSSTKLTRALVDKLYMTEKEK